MFCSETGTTVYAVWVIGDESIREQKPSAGRFLTFPALTRPERLFQPGASITSIRRNGKRGNPPHASSKPNRRE
jgi:hypothetical protein